MTETIILSKFRSGLPSRSFYLAPRLADRDSSSGPEPRSPLGRSQTTLLCNTCNKTFLVRNDKFHICKSRLCNDCRSRVGGGGTGILNHSFKGGTTKNGYICIHFPKHPNVISGGYVYEHRLVMESILERLLLPEEVVHHINGNTTDNRKENLKLFKNSSEHHKLTRGHV